MPISLEKRTFIVSLYEPCKRNSRKATDKYNETYYPERISPQTTRRIWRENDLEISPPGWYGSYTQKKRKRVIETKKVGQLKYLHARGRFCK